MDSATAPVETPSALIPRKDPALRGQLLEFFLCKASGEQLSGWLQDLGVDDRGVLDEKRARVQKNTKYLDTPLMEFPDQTMVYLDFLSAEALADLCETLCLEAFGNKGTRYRRVMREIGYREGWLPRPSVLTAALFTLDRVVPFVRWHRILKNGASERSFYPAFEEDMVEVFGEDYVHPQLTIRSGLKIDFHLGHPQGNGVGVEFKMPSTVSEIHRATGQIQQYRSFYGDQLLVVLLPDKLDKAKEILFMDQMRAQGVRVLVK